MTSKQAVVHKENSAHEHQPTAPAMPSRDAHPVTTSYDWNGHPSIASYRLSTLHSKVIPGHCSSHRSGRGSVARGPRSGCMRIVFPQPPRPRPCANRLGHPRLLSRVIEVIRHKVTLPSLRELALGQAAASNATLALVVRSRCAPSFYELALLKISSRCGLVD
ncbi:hypothetical protein FA95DRAFT_375546 [Auriscalpium vulgare]|uniref:Uncharacterized protein n=1 Tax=Auriscalpium vulgare TaxID=40419 RepID=A0ACB8RH38_9AGAM|nr:hypothetical protein FA95DRAFT_375546 [Auriscalpium vulgare]